MTNTALYLRLLRHVKPYWRVFLLGILGMVVYAATTPVLPALAKPLIEGTFIERDAVVMQWLPAAIILLFVVRGLSAFVAAYGINWVGTRLVTDLRNAMFAKLLAAPAAFYERQPSGALISKLTFDVTQVTVAATSALTLVFRDALMIAGLLGYLLWLNWRLTLFALAMAPLVVAVVQVLSVRLRRSSREVQNAMGSITQVIEEAIGGHKVVKLFGGQAYESRRFDEEANHVRRHLMKQAVAVAASAPVVQLIAAVALALVIWFAMAQSSSAQLSVGEFAAFVTGMLLLMAPLKRVTDINEYLQRGLAAAESVFRLIDEEAEPDRGTHTLARARGEIRLENASFHYGDPARLALEAVDVTVAPGQTVALVGP
ncbi:MAG: ABC transporter ATP-binding protein, partial [Burkholderiales bacterium]